MLYLQRNCPIKIFGLFNRRSYLGVFLHLSVKPVRVALPAGHITVELKECLFRMTPPPSLSPQQDIAQRHDRNKVVRRHVEAGHRQRFSEELKNKRQERDRISRAHREGFVFALACLLHKHYIKITPLVFCVCVCYSRCTSSWEIT